MDRKAKEGKGRQDDGDLWVQTSHCSNPIPHFIIDDYYRRQRPCMYAYLE